MSKVVAYFAEEAAMVNDVSDAAAAVDAFALADMVPTPKKNM